MSWIGRGGGLGDSSRDSVSWWRERRRRHQLTGSSLPPQRRRQWRRYAGSSDHLAEPVNRLTMQRSWPDNYCSEKSVAHTRLPNVGFRSWSRFLAVSLQVAWVINPAVGCQFFSSGLRLPSRLLRGLLPISLLVNRGTMGVNSLPKTITRQRRDCDLNPGPPVPESSTLTTRVAEASLL